MSAQLVASFQRFFPNTFSPKIQAHNLRHIRNPLYSHKPAINPVYHHKAIKFTSCHFSHYNSTLLKKVGAIANLQGPYLRTTSDLNLSPTVTQHLFKRDSSSSLELGCLRREIGAALIICLLNNC